MSAQNEQFNHEIKLNELPRDAGSNTFSQQQTPVESKDEPMELKYESTVRKERPKELKEEQVPLKDGQAVPKHEQTVSQEQAFPEDKAMEPLDEQTDLSDEQADPKDKQAVLRDKQAGPEDNSVEPKDEPTALNDGQTVLEGKQASPEDEPMKPKGEPAVLNNEPKGLKEELVDLGSGAVNVKMECPRQLISIDLDIDFDDDEEDEEALDEKDNRDEIGNDNVQNKDDTGGGENKHVEMGDEVLDIVDMEEAEFTDDSDEEDITGREPYSKVKEEDSEVEAATEDEDKDEDGGDEGGDDENIRANAANVGEAEGANADGDDDDFIVDDDGDDYGGYGDEDGDDDDDDDDDDEDDEDDEDGDGGIDNVDGDSKGEASSVKNEQGLEISEPRPSKKRKKCRKEPVWPLSSSSCQYMETVAGDHYDNLTMFQNSGTFGAAMETEENAKSPNSFSDAFLQFDKRQPTAFAPELGQDVILSNSIVPLWKNAQGKWDKRDLCRLALVNTSAIEAELTYNAFVNSKIEHLDDLLCNLNPVCSIDPTAALHLSEVVMGFIMQTLTITIVKNTKTAISTSNIVQDEACGTGDDESGQNSEVTKANNSKKKKHIGFSTADITGAAKIVLSLMKKERVGLIQERNPFTDWKRLSKRPFTQTQNFVVCKYKPKQRVKIVLDAVKESKEIILDALVNFDCPSFNKIRKHLFGILGLSLDSITNVEIQNATDEPQHAVDESHDMPANDDEDPTITGKQEDELLGEGGKIQQTENESQDQPTNDDDDYASDCRKQEDEFLVEDEDLESQGAKELRPRKSARVEEIERVKKEIEMRRNNLAVDNMKNTILEESVERELRKRIMRSQQSRDGGSAKKEQSSDAEKGKQFHNRQLNADEEASCEVVSFSRLKGLALYAVGALSPPPSSGEKKKKKSKAARNSQNMFRNAEDMQFVEFGQLCPNNHQIRVHHGALIQLQRFTEALVVDEAEILQWCAASDNNRPWIGRSDVALVKAIRREGRFERGKYGMLSSGR